MKDYTLEEFLKLPAGVIFLGSEDSELIGICVKGDTVEIDGHSTFYCGDIYFFAGECNNLELQNYCYLSENYQVLEKEDLLVLKDYIDKGLKLLDGNKI